jgi:hypothetical protein
MKKVWSNFTRLSLSQKMLAEVKNTEMFYLAAADYDEKTCLIVQRSHSSHRRGKSHVIRVQVKWIWLSFYDCWFFFQKTKEFNSWCQMHINIYHPMDKDADSEHPDDAEIVARKIKLKLRKPDVKEPFAALGI